MVASFAQNRSSYRRQPVSTVALMRPAEFLGGRKITVAPVVHRLPNTDTLAVVGGWFATRLADGTVGAIYAGNGYSEIDTEVLRSAIGEQAPMTGFVTLQTWGKQDVNLFTLAREDAAEFGCEFSAVKLSETETVRGAILLTDAALLFLKSGFTANPISGKEARTYDVLPIGQALAEARAVGALTDSTPYGPNVIDLPVEDEELGTRGYKVLATRRGGQRAVVTSAAQTIEDDPFAIRAVAGRTAPAQPQPQAQVVPGDRPRRLL